jgi:hypothetical protein
LDGVGRGYDGGHAYSMLHFKQMEHDGSVFFMGWGLIWICGPWRIGLVAWVGFLRNFCQGIQNLDFDEVFAAQPVECVEDVVFWPAASSLWRFLLGKR